MLLLVRWESLTWRLFVTTGEILISGVILSARGGLRGSTFGLLVGTGFGNGTGFPLTFMFKPGGNASSCSRLGSTTQSLSWT